MCTYGNKNQLMIYRPSTYYSLGIRYPFQVHSLLAGNQIVTLKFLLRFYYFRYECEVITEA
jgi:hypothetical protein